MGVTPDAKNALGSTTCVPSLLCVCFSNQVRSPKSQSYGRRRRTVAAQHGMRAMCARVLLFSFFFFLLMLLFADVVFLRCVCFQLVERRTNEQLNNAMCGE